MHACPASPSDEERSVGDLVACAHFFLADIADEQYIYFDERFLHDARAASLLDAILWHGGEAQRAKETFAALSAEDRAALLLYLRSL